MTAQARCCGGCAARCRIGIRGCVCADCRICLRCRGGVGGIRAAGCVGRSQLGSSLNSAGSLCGRFCFPFHNRPFVVAVGRSGGHRFASVRRWGGRGCMDRCCRNITRDGSGGRRSDPFSSCLSGTMRDRTKKPRKKLKPPRPRTTPRLRAGLGSRIAARIGGIIAALACAHSAYLVFPNACPNRQVRNSDDFLNLAAMHRRVTNTGRKSVWRFKLVLMFSVPKHRGDLSRPSAWFPSTATSAASLRWKKQRGRNLRNVSAYKANSP